MTTFTASFSAELERHLPIVELPSGVSIAFLKLYGDHELLEHCVTELAGLASPTEVLIGAEAGGILLTHLLSGRLNLPYCIARKKHRPHMRNPARVRLSSVGTIGEQELFLDDDDCALVRGRDVTFVDEVVSSGGTQFAIKRLASTAGAERLTQTLCVATEGGDASPDDVTNLIHLPTF